MLFNLVHYQHQQVKEETSKILLSVSQEFDDGHRTLLEVQKINPLKVNYEEFAVNFNEEPNKSQKQILKLVKIVRS